MMTVHGHRLWCIHRLHRMEGCVRSLGCRRGRIAAVGTLASVLAGILGGWLAGHWGWGVACGFLTLLAVAAAAASMNARDEEAPASRSVSVYLGHRSSITGSVIAAGDVDQS